MLTGLKTCVLLFFMKEKLEESFGFRIFGERVSKDTVTVNTVLFKILLLSP